MNYNESLEYIHSVNWLGSKPGLSRTQHLLEKLGNPHKGLRFIHIAGTNGKGSTASMLSSILTRAGYKTGLYTSPYINRFNERMKVNNVDISDDEVAELATLLKPITDEMTEDRPTEFETITGMGMEFFKRHECDIVILEVGLGGLLDSTNVIDVPELAIITAMGMDHTRELGDTMTQIAGEKGGIIKEGCDVVIYGQNEEAEAVFERIAAEKHAALRKADFSRIVPKEFDLDGQSFDFGELKDLRIPLIGSYQLKNASVVLTAVEVLRSKGWNIPEDVVREGLEKTFWPARFEILSKDPVFIVDGGHNPHGITGTADSLRRLFPGRKFTFVTGVMADKDVENILNLVVPLAERFITVCPDNPRAMKADVLAKRIGALGVEAIPAETVAAGVAKAIELAGPEGVVCALGSLYMSGDIRACFQK